jgi:hypothetical protein
MLRHADPATPTRRSQERDFATTLAGCSLIVAPLLLMLWNVLDPAVSDHVTERLTQIADNKARYIAAGYLCLLGAWAFIPGLIGLWRLFREPRVTLGQVGSGLMLIGITTTIAFFGFGVSEYEAAQPGHDPAQMARLADDVESSPIAIPLLIAFLVGVLIGSLMVAWSLWRHRIVPTWSPAAIVVGTILNVLADSPALSALASAFTVVGFGCVGLRLLSMTGETASGPPNSRPMPATGPTATA